MSKGRFLCAARRHGEITACGRCGQLWVGDEAVPCKGRADRPIGLDEMRVVVEGLANDIEDRQPFLVTLRADAVAHGDTKTADSLRNAPRMEELRRAAVLRAIAGLVDRIEGGAEIKKRLRGQGDGEPDKGRATLICSPSSRSRHARTWACRRPRWRRFSIWS